jgi:hypothetical protein
MRHYRGLKWLALISMSVLLSATAMADNKYAGSEKCASCHQAQSRSQMMKAGASAGFLAVIKPLTSLEMFKKNSGNSYANSCNGCHKDWSGDEKGYTNGVKAYEAKFGK